MVYTPRVSRRRRAVREEAAMCKIFSSRSPSASHRWRLNLYGGTGSSRIIRSRSCIATRRSVRSTKARRTCSSDHRKQKSWVRYDASMIEIVLPGYFPNGRKDFDPSLRYPAPRLTSAGEASVPSPMSIHVKQRSKVDGPQHKGLSFIVVKKSCRPRRPARLKPLLSSPRPAVPATTPCPVAA